SAGAVHSSESNRPDFEYSVTVRLPQFMTSALSTGTVIGPYQLLTPLGRGGAATVWAARQDGSLPALPALVALKVLNRETSHDPSFRARFLQEAALLSGIRHPNVVAVFHAGQAATGELFTAMEWIY